MHFESRTWQNHVSFCPFLQSLSFGLDAWSAVYWAIDNSNLCTRLPYSISWLFHCLQLFRPENLILLLTPLPIGSCCYYSIGGADPSHHLYSFLERPYLGFILILQNEKWATFLHLCFIEGGLCFLEQRSFMGRQCWSIDHVFGGLSWNPLYTFYHECTFSFFRFQYQFKQHHRRNIAHNV